METTYLADEATSLDRQRAIWALFFCSGMPALIYQLTWQRALFRIFGVNIESATIVVTAFMIGLGIGSLAGGWISTRKGLSLLPILAVIEAVIGAFGIFSLDLFDRVGDLTINLPLGGMALVVLMVVILPTVMMGATLPVLVGHLVRRDGNVGGTLGQLYYVNTLGAGFACLLSAVTLFPFLGMQATINVAVAMNFAVAIGALIVWRLPGSQAVTADRTRGNGPGRQQIGAMNPPLIPLVQGLGLSFLSGIMALSFEIFFLHVISFADAGSAATFTETLGAFLIGLAGGAKRTGDLCRDATMRAANRFVSRCLLLAALIAMIFLPALLLAAGESRLLQAVAVFLVYLFARCWGAFFPLLIHRTVKADERAGSHLSYLYLANLLGSAVGGVVTGFILMDIFGLRELAALLAVCCLGFAFLAAKLLMTDKDMTDRNTRMPRLAWIGLIAVHLLVFATPLLQPLIGAIQAFKPAPLKTVVENRSGIITVDVDRSIYGNGVYDGQFNIDLVHDTNGVRRAYALELYQPAPRHVLMIGLSSGSWAQVVANAPQVETLTIVEINPGYRQLVAADPDNASLLTNPKVRLVIDDGRRWLRRNPGERFDAIIANTSYNYRANATNVLSVEFMDLIRQHLSPGGTYTYNTTDSQRAMRTGCLSFAHAVRLDNFIIGSDQPLQLDPARWRQALLDWWINGRPILDPSRDPDQAALARNLALPDALKNPPADSADASMEDCSRILARTADLQPITDDNMGTEWRFGLGLDR